MLQKQFFAGTEEVIARLVSLCITLLFFAIYALAKTTFYLDIYTLLTVLGIFWVVYEIFSYILFAIFKFFSKPEQNTPTNLQNSGSNSSTSALETRSTPDETEDTI